MDNVECMKEYIAKATYLVRNVKHHVIEVPEQENSRRVLDGLSSAYYAPEKRKFALKQISA